MNEGVPTYPADPAARNAEAHPGPGADDRENHGPVADAAQHRRPVRADIDGAGLRESCGGCREERPAGAARHPLGGHCEFSEQELTTAFADLVAWVQNGTKPKGEDLWGDLMKAGLEFTNPLRPGDPGGVE